MKALLEYSINMNNVYINMWLQSWKQLLVAFCDMIADGYRIIYFWKKTKNITCSYNKIIIYFISKNVALNLNTILLWKYLVNLIFNQLFSFIHQKRTSMFLWEFRDDTQMSHIFFYLLILFHQIIHYILDGIILTIYLKKHLFLSQI